MNDIISFLISIIRILRGIFDRLLWLKMDLLKIILSVVSAYTAFIFFTPPNKIDLSYFFNINNISLFIKVVSIVILFIAGIKLFVLLRTNVSFKKILPYLDENTLDYKTKAETEKIGQKPDELIHTFKQQSIVYSPSLNAVIESGCNKINFKKTPFTVHPIVKKLLPLFILRMPESNIDTFDSKKVRLNSDLNKAFIDASSVVQLQRTSYFRDRLSNTLVNYEISLDGRFFLELRREVVKNRKLTSLRESQLSNQLGGSVILITQNGTITYLNQGNRTAENACRPSPAGSGSFDYIRKITLESMTFQEYAKQETRRELSEECGLKKSDIVDIQICGFGRYVYRSGKPEIFCIASTRRDSNYIVPPVREWDYQQKVPMVEVMHDGICNKENTLKALISLKQKMDSKVNGLDNASGPLYWNVLFAIDYLRNISKTKEAKLFPWVLKSNSQ